MKKSKMKKLLNLYKSYRRVAGEIVSDYTLVNKRGEHKTFMCAECEEPLHQHDRYYTINHLDGCRLESVSGIDNEIDELEKQNEEK